MGYLYRIINYEIANMVSFVLRDGLYSGTVFF